MHSIYCSILRLIQHRKIRIFSILPKCYVLNYTVCSELFKRWLRFFRISCQIVTSIMFETVKISKKFQENVPLRGRRHKAPYVVNFCTTISLAALFQNSFFCWTENRYFEEIFKLRDIFELIKTIHFKKLPHQAGMKAKRLVHWSFLCRDNL